MPKGGLPGIPTCHPDRRHKGHGLCHPCYKKWRYPADGSAYRRRATAWYTNVGRLRKYGIGQGEIQELFDMQGGVCAICGHSEKIDRALHVDHDHATNEVRGLLCNACNTGLGLFRDSPALLEAAMDYLACHNYLKGKAS